LASKQSAVVVVELYRRWLTVPAAVEVRLDVFAEMQHSFQMMAGRAPEADDAIARPAGRLRPELGA
jgi:hypothetical protein